MERVCVYPGSFDPVTSGHMDIIKRSAALFDRVMVAVLHNPEKTGCFPLECRVNMLRKACNGLEKVHIDAYDGLLVEYCKATGAQVIVRGLRAVSDFENEFQMAQVNHQILPTVETLFMMSLPEHAYISSSIVRELASFGGNIAPFLPEEILEDVRDYFVS